MLAAIVCDRFGWTYYEYIDQPAQFIRAVLYMIRAENDARKREQRRSGD